MILSQMQKDVEQIQACLAKGNIDEAETMLELVLMDIKNAQPSVQWIGYQTAIIPCPHCGINVTIDSDMLIANR